MHATFATSMTGDMIFTIRLWMIWTTSIVGDFLRRTQLTRMWRDLRVEDDRNDGGLKALKQPQVTMRSNAMPIKVEFRAPLNNLGCVPELGLPACVVMNVYRPAPAEPCVAGSSLTCGLCHKLFADSPGTVGSDLPDRRPRLLGCAHYFCTTCIEQLPIQDKNVM